MPVEVAAPAGFCMGVRRAVEMAEAATRDGIPSCSLGELIHNPEVVRRLAGKGLAPVSAPEEAAGRRVLIRSHGVSAEVMERLAAAGCEILDLTCPFVDKLHRIVIRGKSSRDLRGLRGHAAVDQHNPHVRQRKPQQQQQKVEVTPAHVERALDDGAFIYSPADD